MASTLLERLGSALAAMPPMPFYLACCLAVIGLTVVGEVALTMAGVPETQVLSALAPTVPIVGILVVSLRNAALADAARRADQLDIARRVDQVIARARSVSEVVRLLQAGAEPDPHQLERWKAVAAALEAVARRTGDPADVEAARQMADLVREYRDPRPPGEGPPDPSPFDGAPPP
jgi:hypothetical protein